MSTIGSRIHDRRLELCMSADDLAAQLGKNRATIYRYESNEIENLPVAVIGPLAEALQISPAYLMGWSLKKTPESEWIDTFCERLSEDMDTWDITDAKEAGIDLDYLCGIINGEVSITLKEAYDISAEAGIPFLYLCGITDDKNEKKPTPVSGDGLDDMERLIMKYVRTLTPDQQQMLLAQMRVMRESQKKQSVPSARP